MVEGLDQVAKRSEEQEAVDRIKQRSGRIIMNEAIHVDAKGRRWQRIVLVGVIAAVLSAVGLVLFLIHLANSSGISDQEAARDTRGLLAQYTNLVYSIEPVPAGKNLSVEELKQKLRAKIQEEIKRFQQVAQRTGPGRRRERSEALKSIRLLEKALRFKDGQGQPFVIKQKDKTVFTITSTSSKNAFTEIQVPQAGADRSP